MKLQTPFRMVVTGPTGSGKTKYLTDMLSKHYVGVFDYIILLCPTYSHNKTWQEWKYVNDPDFLPIEPHPDYVDEWVKTVTHLLKGTNSLIILDDLAFTNTSKNRSSALIELAFSGRHWGISTIQVTQQLTSISKPFRENLTAMVVFYSSNRTAMNTVFDELDGVTKEEEDEIRKTLRENHHARLEVRLEHPFEHRVFINE